MDWIASEYELGRLVLTRGIAVVFVIAFINVINQFRPLLGDDGLLPVSDFLGGRGFKDAPSLLFFGYSDDRLARLAWLGVALSAGAGFGLADLVPWWLSMVWWLVIWLLYLSVVNVGQVFYGFGWESLLLESGFYVAFLGNATTPTPLLTMWLFRWLLFRVEFGAGMIKLRGDRCWRDLACLDYHHETQPLPNPLSRWFHSLPKWIHRIEAGANFAVQLLAPFLLFFPQPVAGAAAVAIFASQSYLMISGNYAWLNLLTMLLAFAAIPDSWFGLGGDTGGSLGALALVVAYVTFGVVLLSYWPVMNLLGRRQSMNRSFNRFHLVNAYGAFGSVTRQRREVIIEGCAKGASSMWLPYEFKAKPGAVDRVPRQIAPYHLRLDWLMWFAALSPEFGRGWLEKLLEKLLLNDPAVLALLADNPFDGEPPASVRARLVDYRFATADQRHELGLVWTTGESRILIGPRSLSD